jgi:hypothetical protein
MEASFIRGLAMMQARSPATRVLRHFLSGNQRRKERRINRRQREMGHKPTRV